MNHLRKVRFNNMKKINHVINNSMVKTHKIEFDDNSSRLLRTTLNLVFWGYFVKKVFDP